MLTRAVALGRNTWRTLTSMGTALVLLFLLALASIPGALWPQRQVNPTTVAGYIADNPRLGVPGNDVGVSRLVGGSPPSAV